MMLQISTVALVAASLAAVAVAAPVENLVSSPHTLKLILLHVLKLLVSSSMAPMLSLTICSVVLLLQLR